MPPVRFRDVAIIGGGCYGSFYAGQLAAARAKGAAAWRTVLVADRDPGCPMFRPGRLAAGFAAAVSAWDDFIDDFADRPPPPEGEPDDAVVPSPLMPHLMAHWATRLAGRLGLAAVAVPAEQPFGTPFDRLAPDGTRYVSFADWICPTHCIEPRRCPAIAAPRTWEMADAVRAYAAGPAGVALEPALFVTSHRVFGVGMFDVAAARAARRVIETVRDTGRPADLLVATVSSCHGAVTRLRLAPR